MSKRRDRGWRDRAASELLVGVLPGLTLSGLALVVEDPLPGVGNALEGGGFPVTVWNRRSLGGRPAAPWPSHGPFGVVALRLPRSKEELAMALHASASVMEPGGTLLIYGAKDEGIRGAGTLTDEVFDNAETLAVGGHARVLMATRKEDQGEVRGNLQAWRAALDPGHPELPQVWVSYPGVFAHGHLDPGTGLLLDSLPPLSPGARVLDYGCGAGAVGAVAGARGEGLELDLLDVDAPALEAARENVPEARFILADGLPGEGHGPYDAILSNPPFHRGKEEDPEMITEFIRSAGGSLRPRGILVLVAQRRLVVDRELEKSFRQVDVLAEDSTYRVWAGRVPNRRR